jgi:hypothetical protein
MAAAASAPENYFHGDRMYLWKSGVRCLVSFINLPAATLAKTLAIVRHVNRTRWRHCLTQLLEYIWSSAGDMLTVRYQIRRLRVM